MYRIIGGFVLLVVDVAGATAAFINEDWVTAFVFSGLAICALMVIGLGHHEWHSTD